MGATRRITRRYPFLLRPSTDWLRQLWRGGDRRFDGLVSGSLTGGWCGVSSLRVASGPPSLFELRRDTIRQ